MTGRIDDFAMLRLREACWILQQAHVNRTHLGDIVMSPPKVKAFGDRYNWAWQTLGLFLDGKGPFDVTNFGNGEEVPQLHLGHEGTAGAGELKPRQ